MSEHTTKSYEYWREASQRFDYFVTGITGALCAYSIQHFEPQRISFSPYLLELLAVIFLLASFIIGLRQIEHKVVLLKRSATRIEKSEMLSELVSSQLKGPPAPILLHSKQGVEIKDPASVNKDIQLLKIEIEVLSESEDKLVSAALRTYNWRNRLLVLGFLLLVVAKIVQPYASGPAAQP